MVFLILSSSSLDVLVLKGFRVSHSTFTLPYALVLVPPELDGISSPADCSPCSTHSL